MVIYRIFVPKKKISHTQTAFSRSSNSMDDSKGRSRVIPCSRT